MHWQLWWEFTSLLVEEVRNGAGEEAAEVGRDRAEAVAASLARGYWPPDAARLPWVTAACPR